MYEKDGEKYFIVDSHLHFWDASPENWVKGQEEYAKGWIECFHAYQGLGPPETHWTIEHFRSTRSTTSRRTSSPTGYVDHGDLPVDVPEASGTQRASTTSSRTRRCWTASPASCIVNGRWDPREGEAGPASSCASRPREVRPARASSSTPPSGWAARAAGR